MAVSLDERHWIMAVKHCSLGRTRMICWIMLSSVGNGGHMLDYTMLVGGSNGELGSEAGGDMMKRGNAPFSTLVVLPSLC